jgi:hypothetical protein
MAKIFNPVCSVHEEIGKKFVCMTQQKKISGNNNSLNKSSFCTSNVVVEAVVVVVAVAAFADVLHDPDDI